MRCPFCQSELTKVIDSRSIEERNSIKRRRQCENCERRFTTYEVIEKTPLIIIKKDNSRQNFSREKLKNGIVRSCNKLSVPMEEIENLVDDIENSLQSSFKQEINSSYIGELVMEKLKKMNQVAYVRFASIYKEFRDIEAFMEELVNIKNNDSKDNKED